MKLVRSILFVLWLYTTMGVMGVVLLPWALTSWRRAIMAVRWWTHVALFGMRWIVGARVVIEGRENLPKGPLIVAMKHQAMLDTFAPFLFLDAPAIVYKAELKWAPAFGWYVQAAHMIPVERATQAAALKSMLRAARKAIPEGRQILIFPEGTRKWIGSKPDYKPGVIALYRDLNLPCVPVALNTGLVWKPKGIMRNPGVVTFRILPPIPPGLSREEFMQRLETSIEDASEALLPAHLRRAPVAA